jgi:dTDP-4-dehydrorhamnose 3,5-epimerase
MKIIDTEIKEVKIIEPTIFGDSRGFFYESFSQKKYQEALDMRHTFVQDNFSRSNRGVLRGLHHQTENTQGKLVSVLDGEVFDVAVDVRVGSPTFGKSVGVLLTADNRRQLWVPPGFAHGFLVLSESVDFVYKCTDYYNPKAELSIKWDDEDINVQWPTKENLTISDKDINLAKSLKESKSLLPKYGEF